MRKIQTRIVDTPIGNLTLVAEAGGLSAIRFGAIIEENSVQSDPALSDTLDCAARQLEEYFSGARRVFSVPLQIKGTPFQQMVWQALMEIDYGETACYAEIACRIDKPLACRAVGMANNRNPLPIIIPCHRVIGKNGALTGYAGGLEMKTWLLELEKQGS